MKHHFCRENYSVKLRVFDAVHNLNGSAPNRFGSDCSTPTLLLCFLGYKTGGDLGIAL